MRPWFITRTVSIVMNGVIQSRAGIGQGVIYDAPTRGDAGGAFMRPWFIARTVSIVMNGVIQSRSGIGQGVNNDVIGCGAGINTGVINDARVGGNVGGAFMRPWFAAADQKRSDAPTYGPSTSTLSLRLPLLFSSIYW